jgi:dTDP-4-dehydrorhamnose 3,5-epimerase
MDRRLSVHPTRLAGLVVVHSAGHVDQRGSFTRLFCENELADALHGKHIVQANQSRSNVAGTIRGLHYQVNPYSEIKLVRCTRGRVWDVAVDLRAESPTFLQWHAEELSDDNANMMLIPERFAHGFQTLVDDCDLLYLHTGLHASGAERGLRFDDNALTIKWPLPALALSERDRAWPTVTPDFNGASV